MATNFNWSAQNATRGFTGVLFDRGGYKYFRGLLGMDGTPYPITDPSTGLPFTPAGYEVYIPTAGWLLGSIQWSTEYTVTTGAPTTVQTTVIVSFSGTSTKGTMGPPVQYSASTTTPGKYPVSSQSCNLGGTNFLTGIVVVNGSILNKTTHTPTSPPPVNTATATQVSSTQTQSTASDSSLLLIVIGGVFLCVCAIVAGVVLTVWLSRKSSNSDQKEAATPTSASQ